MPRYFYTPNASKPYKRGGYTFVFEVCGRVAQQQMGMLAVDDEKAAAVLAAYGHPVREVTAEEFAELKKNKPTSMPLWMRGAPADPRPSYQAPSPAVLLAAEPASTASTGTASSAAPEAPPPSEPSAPDPAALPEPPLDLAVETTPPPDLPSSEEAADRPRRSGASRRGR